MSRQYIPLEKRSKKEQKAYYSAKRHTFGELNPVTRSVPSGKVYNRKKEKRKDRSFEEWSGGLFYCFSALHEL